MTKDSTGFAVIAVAAVALYYMISKDIGKVSDALKQPVADVFNWFNTPLPQPKDVLGVFNPMDAKNWFTSPDNWIWDYLKMPGTKDPVRAVQPESGGVISVPGLPDLITQPGDFIDPSLIRSGRWQPQPQLPEPIRVLWDDSGISAPQSYVDSVGGGSSPPAVGSPGSSIVINQWGESSSGSGGGTYSPGYEPGTF